MRSLAFEMFKNITQSPFISVLWRTVFHCLGRLSIALTWARRCPSPRVRGAARSVTQGEDCPLDAVHSPDYPEAVQVVVSTNAELKALREKNQQPLLHVVLFLVFLLTVAGTCLVGVSRKMSAGAGSKAEISAG